MSSFRAILDTAVRLGHLEVARELLQRGVRLASPLSKDDLEATTPSEEGDPSEPTVWRGPWRWWRPPANIVCTCPLGCARRDVWRQWTPRDEADSESDSFSGDPEVWLDPSGQHWRNEDTDDGICFFGWWCQGTRCEWAADWDQPISKCQARVATPATRLILALAARGGLSSLEIEPGCAARLLDAAILLGEPEAAAEVVARFPRIPRTLRFWSFDDLIDHYGHSVGHGGLRSFVVMAAVEAGAEVSSIHHPGSSEGSVLFEYVVGDGHAQLAHMIMQRSVMPPTLSNHFGSLIVRRDETMGQLRLRAPPLAIAAAVAAELSRVRLRCEMSCTACRASAEVVDVSLRGVAILSGDVQHAKALVAQTHRYCTLAFQAPLAAQVLGIDAHDIADAHVLFGAALRGVCHACSAGAKCFSYTSGSECHAVPLEQRRMAAAAALREGLRLNHCQAGAMYGRALAQWARWIVRRGKSTRGAVDQWT